MTGRNTYLASPAEMTDDELAGWVKSFKADPPTMDYMVEYGWACRVSAEHKRRSEAAAAAVTVVAPVPFAGTAAEAAANRASHAFGGEDGRCFHCDCKPWHLSASYPCGVEPARAEMSEAEYAARTGGFGALFA